MAQGPRFLRNVYNVFDAVVIYASCAMAVIIYTMEQSAQEQPPLLPNATAHNASLLRLSANASSDLSELQTAKSSTTPLRMISRVAMGMRVLRVLMHMRKVNELKGSVQASLRTAVSQNKRRYKKDGFDLDLTYITDRIIAMSAPALGGIKSWRNDGHTVSRFLSLKHYAAFFVFNLCDTYTSSDDVVGQYHPQMFFNQVQRIPFEDHGPPLLVELVHFCREASKWLESNPANVVIVHCKGGKGRTGVMIAALMLWCGHRKCAMDAMELFTFRRTENYDREAGIDDSLSLDSDLDLFSAKKKTQGQKRKPNRGVDGPSQQRYVLYLESMLYQGIQPFSASTIILEALRIPVGAAQKTKPWFLSFTVTCQRTIVFDSLGKKGNISTFGGSGEAGQVLRLPANVPLCEDTKIEMFRHRSDKDTSPLENRKLLWFVVFHPAFYAGRSEIVFSKKKVDMLHKDLKASKADPDFTLTLEVSADMKHPFLEKHEQVVDAFSRHGQPKYVSAGEPILSESENSLLLVTHGLAEAVLKRNVSDINYTPQRGRLSEQTTMSSRQGNTQHFHPCGFPVPDAGAKANSLACRDYCPVHTLFGPGHVLGIASFMRSTKAYAFRARTDVRVLVLRRHFVEEEGEEDTDDESTSSPQGKLGEGSVVETSELALQEDFNDISAVDWALDVKHTVTQNVESPRRGAAHVQRGSMDHSFRRSPLRQVLPHRRAWLVKKRLNILQATLNLTP